MNEMLAPAPPRPPRRLVRAFRFAAAALVLHGVLLSLSAALQPLFPDAFEVAGAVLFFVLALPALLLTSPFTSLLWSLGLMNAPGWFAWPKPLGIALAYAIWVALLLGVAQAIHKWPARR
jgi:hypothetical protein